MIIFQLIVVQFYGFKNGSFFFNNFTKFYGTIFDVCVKAEKKANKSSCNDLVLRNNPLGFY